MNTFYNQMFNPQYVNPNYYFEVMKQKQNKSTQTEEIEKAVNAMHDLCEALKKIDDKYQQEAFNACLAEMALQFKWNI